MDKLCRSRTRRTMALLIVILFSVSMFTVAFKSLADEGSAPFVVKKYVDNGAAKLKIDDWLAGAGYSPEAISGILADISFELYPSNESGSQLDDDPVATCGVGADGTIIFPPGFEPGWYLMREAMGDEAKAVFRDGAADLLVYYNVGPEFTEDTRFTVTQFKDQTRQLQALYRDEDGVVRSAYTSPALDIDPPLPGGGALGTSRFEATQDNGDKFTSFCSDIGALQCNGEYLIDEAKHNFSSEQMLRLIAALDFVYARSGFSQYDDIALAQLVVWNLILEYTDDPMTADLWILSPGLLLKDAWGDLFKIEGITTFNGVDYWYVHEYRDLIDDIIANADNDKYVDIYFARIEAGVQKFVSGAYFLKGDGTYPGYQQQRQLIITFGSSKTFNNIPYPPTPTPTPPPEPGRLEITKVFNIEAIPDTWSAKVTVTGPNGFSAEGTITGANRVYTLTNLEYGLYTVTETDPDGITGYLFFEVTGNGTYEVSEGTTTATLTNIYATPTPTPTPTATPTPTPPATPTPTPPPTPTPRGRPTPTPTPTPTPETGRLDVTKAFNITDVPDAWSATIAVAGPNGYSASGTITGADRTLSFTGLELGLYSVTETGPDDVEFYALYSVTGEGTYTVSSGTTAVTITNNYEVEEIEDVDVPQDDFPIDEPDVPKSDMPKTDSSDNIPPYAFGLCVSFFALGFTIHAIRYTGRTARARK